jgi:hypothetical protein
MNLTKEQILKIDSNLDGSPNIQKASLFEPILARYAGLYNSNNSKLSHVKYIFPIFIKAYPNLIAHELVNVKTDFSDDIPSKDLATRITFESAQDAMSSQGLDIEDELTTMWADAVAAELNTAFLDDLLTIAGEPQIFWEEDQTVDFDEKFNRVVVSRSVFSMIAASSRFTPATDFINMRDYYQGLFDDKIKIYVNEGWIGNHPILLCSQNENTAGDYLIDRPLICGEIMIDPQTYEPFITLSSKCCFVPNPDSIQHIATIGINF